MNAFAISALSGALAIALCGDAVNYKKSNEIAMPGGSYWDYLSIDSAGRRLYVAHAPNIEVFDLDKGERVGMIEGIEGAHGAWVHPDLKNGFATAGKKNAIEVFDPKTLKVIKEIAVGKNPDALLYVTTTKEIWSIDHTGGTVTCVDPVTLEVKSTIEVGGKLEFAQEWAAKGQVFVNVEDKSEVAAIDAKEHKVLARYPLAPAAEPTGMALDAKNGLIFCGCDKMLAVLDAATGKVVTTQPIGSGCDAVAFDAEKSLVFASCGDGTTAVVRELDSKKFEVAGTIQTASGARTCTLDPKTHKLWTVAGTRGKDDAKLLSFAPEDKPVPASGPVK
jgi:DNA-binding beta-propeller fold protein YncE